LPANYKSEKPFTVAPLRADPASSACPKVIEQVGASLVRDAVDQRLINDFKQRTGKLINSQDEVGGWPVLRSLAAALDSDGDGMPDDWEVARGLNPNNAADGALVHKQTGYTNLEVYLAELVAKKLKP
jgi:hypothetical protein